MEEAVGTGQRRRGPACVRRRSCGRGSGGGGACGRSAKPHGTHSPTDALAHVGALVEKVRAQRPRHRAAGAPPTPSAIRAPRGRGRRKCHHMTGTPNRSSFFNLHFQEQHNLSCLTQLCSLPGAKYACRAITTFSPDGELPSPCRL